MNPFVKTDAGRSISRRSKQKNDCTVRALAAAAEIDYDLAYDFLAMHGRKCSQGFFLNKLLENYVKSKTLLFGYKVIKHSFPAQRGMRRMNIDTFCRTYKKGRFILREACHMSAAIDGFLYDTAYCANHCVYIAYELKKGN